MVRCLSVAVGLMCLAGCELIESSQTPAQVSANYFGLQAANTTTTHCNFQNADQTVCMRVDSIGRKILLENPQITVRPRFAAVLSESPEIFHLEEGLIVMSEGLVKQCRSDADVAALISFELGRMVAEARESRVSPQARRAEARPPITVAVGNPTQGMTEDTVHALEMARYEEERARSKKALARPDPANLARLYLVAAGYQKSDFETAAPLFQVADQNVTLERTMKGTVTSGRWTP